MGQNKNSKHETPAFAEAASRRQANFETISNNQNPKFKTDNMKVIERIKEMALE